MRPRDLTRLIRTALAEDLKSGGDVTTRALLTSKARLNGRIVAKERGVVCGTAVAAHVFKIVDRGCRVSVLRSDGRHVRRGETVMTMSGGAGMLAAERTALNFLCHLSGVATLSAAYAAKLRGTKAEILDTRKTLPGLRTLQKYAVLCGGGRNHRFGLWDMALFKDNHWAMGDVERAVRALKKTRPRLTVEVEAKTIVQVQKALKAGADIILLDNMSIPRLRRAIRLIRSAAPKTKIEISGGVTLQNIRALARLGVDRISVGRLTHSAKALDMSLEIP